MKSGDRPTVAEFFQGRSVLVTGGLGFLGKVLVEKLLRSCPGIEKIYMIIREKRGKDAARRLKDCLELPVFDRLKIEVPGAIDKLIAVPGDMMSLGLALSPESRKDLEDNVSVVFHAAATVRFDDPLKSAILMNVRGTREVLDIAANMKKLKVFVHVSTTYCNTHRRDIGEEIYPTHGDWRQMIKTVETVDEPTLNAVTAKLLGVMPNTYTYSKGIAEHMVNEYRQHMPIIIYRPSIVVGSYQEPVPGWIDNFNGPVGLFVAGGKGIMRYIYAAPDVASDFMPVDIAIKAMVIAAWLEGISPRAKDIPVYNASSGQLQKVTAQQIIDKGAILGRETPLPQVLWTPRQTLTTCYAHYYLGVLVTHMLPALLIDTALFASGKKPMLTKIQRRIFVANTAVAFFTQTEWNFANERFLGLDDTVLPEDRASWAFNPSGVDVNDFMKRSFEGGRKYLLHEDESNLPQARINYNRMLWLDRVTRGLFYATVVWYLHSHAILQTTLTTVGDSLGVLVGLD